MLSRQALTKGVTDACFFSSSQDGSGDRKMCKSIFVQAVLIASVVPGSLSAKRSHDATSECASNICKVKPTDLPKSCY